MENALGLTAMRQRTSTLLILSLLVSLDKVEDERRDTMTLLDTETATDSIVESIIERMTEKKHRTVMQRILDPILETVLSVVGFGPVLHSMSTRESANE